MLKNIHCSLFLMVLIVFSGCATSNCTATDPNDNGWGVIQQMDDWIQKNLW